MSEKLDRNAVRAALDGYVPRVLSAVDYFGEDFPDYFDVGQGRWHVNGFWTEGFWPGLLWKLYLHSGDDRARMLARRATRRLAELKRDMDDHDLGFLFLPSCVQECAITGGHEMAGPALAAAGRLAARYRLPGKYIPAHGPVDGPNAGFAIIDTIMNLRLLFWAARQTREVRLAEIGTTVARTIAREHVRPDGSSCQVLWFDPTSGRVVRRDAVMAVSADSCWARAQAWGIHGFAEVFLETGEREFRDTAIRMAGYFEARRPADGIVFHDLDDPAAPAVPRDSSAQAIAAAGVMILAEAARDPAERQHWQGMAERWLAPLVAREIVVAGPESRPPRGLLGHGCKSLRKNQGVVSEIVFGDYYFVDALLRWLKCDPRADVTRIA